MYTDIEKLLPFIVFVISYAFGTYIFLREPNLAVNRLFIVIILAPFIEDLVNLLFWLKIFNYGYWLPAAGELSLWILPPLYYHFLEIFEGKSASMKSIAPAYFTAAAFYSIYAFLGFDFLKTAYPAVSILWLFWSLMRLPAAKPPARHRQKTQYLLVYSGFIINFMIVALLHFENTEYFLQIKMLSPLIIVSFIATALLKLRLANIFYILKKSSVYAFFLFIFIFSYLAGAVSLFNYLQIINNIYAIYYMSVFFILFAIIFRPIVDFIRNFIDQNIFRSAYNYKIIVENFSQKLSTLVNLDAVLEHISGILIETFKPNVIFFHRLSGNDNRIQLLYGEKPNIIQQNFYDIENYFREIYSIDLKVRSLEPIFADNIIGRETSESVNDFLMKAKVCLIFPVYYEYTIMGFYFMGYKFMKDDYNDDDIQLITTILNQARVAFSNVQIYKTLVESNQKLEETIIELKNTQDELAQKERFAALGRLAANIAHEVKNPLGIMKVSASSLATALNDRPKLKEIAEFINKEVDRLNIFVSELLNFARDREIQKIKVEVTRMAAELVEKAKLYAASESKDASVTCEISPKYRNGYCIMVDEDQFLRAMLNIIINGIDSTPAGRRCDIRIDISESGGGREISFSVIDNGCGIDEAQIKKGFEPFYTTKKNGTGLGLPVAQQIVEKHGGALRMSRAETCGTRVTITIPDGE